RLQAKRMAAVVRLSTRTRAATCSRGRPTMRGLRSRAISRRLRTRARALVQTS
ncbi:unnamed protein product, partial [Aphanomyces euteiches]